MQRLVLVLAGLAAGCLNSDVVPCGDHVCRAGTVCAALTNPDEPICATRDQIAACTDDHCDGACNNGVCIPVVCGDGRLEGNEACDDSNVVSGDGCSADCSSSEKCGDGHLDPIELVNGAATLAEQCDDGNLASGDGCSSTCLTETTTWREIANGPGGLAGAGVAFDPVRNRQVLFGGFALDPVTKKSRPTSGTFEYTTGWRGVTAPNAPSPRANLSMAYDGVRHHILMFGGEVEQGESIAFGDTWEWDGVNWQELDVPSPPARANAAMAYNPIRKVVVLVGGASHDFGDSSKPIVRDDQWEWDGTSGAGWYEVGTSLPAGLARYGHNMVWDPTRAVMVITGGVDANGTPLTDTWELANGTWHAVTTATPAPALYRAGLLATGGQILEIGGALDAKQTAFKADTWAYDPSATPPTWTNLGEPLSSPRANLTAIRHPDGYPMVYGGVTGSNPEAVTDQTAWLYVTGWDPTFTPTPLSVPPARVGMATAYSPTSHRSFVFGGIDAARNLLGDLWSTSDGTWDQPFINNTPAPRELAAMVFDVRDHLVLFGGKDNTQTFPDTLVVENGTWTPQTLATSPAARYGAAITYDAATQQAVMFGGASDNPDTVYGDTWLWDGSAWHEQTFSGPTPAPRLVPSMAYDPISKHVIMTGGIGLTNGAPVVSDETWSYDGTAWTLVGPTVNPPRVFSAMAYDVRQKRIVLFGGSTGEGLDDTWAWDDGAHAWHREVVANGPPARSEGALVEVDAEGGLLLFGGEAGSADAGVPFSDQWILRLESTTSPELCELPLDNDHDGLVGCADPDCWSTCTPLCPPGGDPSCAMTSTPRCGDGSCEGTFEDCRSCPTDCKICSAPRCGDTFCDVTDDMNTTETHANCPGDCP